MHKLKLAVIPVVILCGLMACSPVDQTPTEQAETTLPGAAQPSEAPTVSAFPALVKSYKVVGRLNVAVTTSQRSIGSWQITSIARTRGEWAQTAKQAALDLHAQYGTDYTEVLLMPDEHIAGIIYAQVGYAADGRGSLGLDGADLTYYEWDVRVADRPLTDEEYAIAELWEQKSLDFPSSAPWSNTLYDSEALREYIAETLNIDPGQVEYPTLIPKKYEGWTAQSRLTIRPRTHSASGASSNSPAASAVIVATTSASSVMRLKPLIPRNVAITTKATRLFPSM